MKFDRDAVERTSRDKPEGDCGDTEERERGNRPRLPADVPWGQAHPTLDSLSHRAAPHEGA